MCEGALDRHIAGGMGIGFGLTLGQRALADEVRPSVELVPLDGFSR